MDSTSHRSFSSSSFTDFSHAFCVFILIFKLMSMPLEHDYIGLTESVPPLESSEKSSDRRNNGGLNLKATELRLGLPGSESPRRDDGLEDNNGYPLKSSVSGAKRGFSVAIDRASAKWVLPSSAGSEADSSKPGGLFSPRVNENNKTQPSSTAVSGVKDGISPSAKSLHEEKPQLSAPAAKYVFPHLFLRFDFPLLIRVWFGTVLVQHLFLSLPSVQLYFLASSLI